MLLSDRMLLSMENQSSSKTTFLVKQMSWHLTSF